MNEDGFDLKSMISILYKGKKLIIGAVLLCVLVACFIVFTTSELWIARIQLEQKSGVSRLYLKLSGLKYLFLEAGEWEEFDRNFNSKAALKMYFKTFNSPLNQENFRDYFSELSGNDSAVVTGSFFADEYRSEAFTGELRFQTNSADVASKVLHEYIRFTDKIFAQQQEELAKILVENKKGEFQEGILLLHQREKGRSRKDGSVYESQIDMLKGNVVALNTFIYDVEAMTLANLSNLSELTVEKTTAKPGVLITLGLMAGLFMGLSLVLFLNYLRVHRGFKGLIYE